MPTVVVLGSGTSNGVPMLGHSYPDGYLDDPRNHRMRAAICVFGPSGNLLVDCPPELRLQMTRENILDVEAVLITHTHADHVMGMDDLRSICMRDNRDIPVYTLPRYQDDIRRIYPYAFQVFAPGIFVPRFDLRDVTEELTIGGMEITTFLVEHGPFPVIGIRINDFAYITDVSFIPPAAWEKLHGLETLMIDAVRYRPHPNHFHLERAVEVSQQLGARRTILTHLSHDYDHGPTQEKLPAGVELAFDGLRFDV
jgi:phosphoribosyl 1,2-cyclic phosphate phosphodiesterase